MWLEKIKFEVERMESIVGKEENADFQYFLLYPYCCQTFVFLSISFVKTRDCLVNH